MSTPLFPTAGHNPLSATDEATLVARIQSGETHLFAQLIQPHLRTINFLCGTILGNPVDAEEAAQETILKAFAHIKRLRTCQCFRSWLMQIAIHEARMRQKKERRHLYESIEDQDERGHNNPKVPRALVEWREIPSQELEKKEVREAVGRALQSLETMYREVLVLKDMQQLNISNIAEILGISEAAVTTRLHRARLKMRAMLAPLFERPKDRWMPLTMALDMSKQYMHRTVSCKIVIAELSNYLDGKLDPKLAREIEEHVARCHRCSFLLDSVRKTLLIVGDERAFQVPFTSERLNQALRDRLKQHF